MLPRHRTGDLNMVVDADESGDTQAVNVEVTHRSTLVGAGQGHAGGAFELLHVRGDGQTVSVHQRVPKPVQQVIAPRRRPIRRFASH